MMKIAYITAQIPYGQAETFIIHEMLAIKEVKVDLLIIPRSPTKKVFHKEAKNLLPNTIWLPLINLKIVYIFLISLIAKLRLWKILLSIVRNSQTLKILVKNLMVIPKGVFVANLLREKRVNHIHAHWGSTTATTAYIASRIIGIPWSFTLHRWDIKENNMLKEKVKSAEFVRCISEYGKNELPGIIGKNYEEKVKVLYIGVKMPENIQVLNDKKNKISKFKIAVPADLIEIKGHQYLIEACAILVNQGVKNFQCIFYGNGPMKDQLEKFISKKGLKDYIKLSKMLPHEELIKMYKNKEIDLVVLPSIITEKGELEGIPVALMEAMAYSIPVISTNTGGIPELLSKNAGIIVQEKNPEQLATAMKKFIKKRNFREKIGKQGYERVRKKFDVQKNTEKLLKLFKYYS